MEVLYPRCAGLDVHKDVVVAAIRCVSELRHQEVRSFATTTSGLLALSEWLASHGCTHVAMEATGVYWKPVWRVLEGELELVLANAQHVHNVPGRKTDVADAAWIADLLAHGLIRSSFVPPAPIQELRDLTRTRKQLTGEISQHSLRLQKILDHRALLRLHLQLVDALQAALGEIDASLGKALASIQHAVRRLTTMPGVGEIVAHVIVAEIGLDMSHFPTPAHLISWAGLCPRSDESAGKRRSVRVRKGAPWLKTTLVTAAWAAVRTKDSYLRAQFLRINSRRGAKKAILAVAASMLNASFFMLRNDVDHQDLGATHFDRFDRRHAIRRLVRRLEDLGCQVEISAHAA